MVRTEDLCGVFVDNTKVFSAKRNRLCLLRLCLSQTVPVLTNRLHLSDNFFGIIWDNVHIERKRF